MIIDQYESLDKDVTAFWEKFSSPRLGRKTFTQIVNAIREERKKANQEDARRAQIEYPDALFRDHFWYIKSGQRRIYTKTADIARKYRELKGRTVQTRENSEE